MEPEQLRDLVVGALEDMKAVDIRVLDVRGVTAITDIMVIASGTSDRHVKSLANGVLAKAREAGIKPLGVEGESGAEWILVDLRDVVVHIMLPRIRDFYNLEKLWSMDSSSDTAPAPGQSG